jgi:RNA polymerase sigma factor (sigma-70 family)
VRLLGDFDIAEEIVQDTLVTALERWRADGIPDRPGAWLTTAARRRAIDRLRRDGAYRHKLALLAAEPFAPADPDDRLRLIFTCCHPALSREAQLALTLRAVCGFTTAQIAHAFVVSESAVAQRLARARRKIVIGGIPYRVPDPDELDERLDQVLYPRHAETLGLLALIRLHLARAGSRFTADHDLILLPDQDRGRWDRALIADALALLDRAATLRRPGPYQLQAAIVACHTEATTWQDTTGSRFSRCTTSCSPTRRPRSSGSTAPSPSSRSPAQPRPSASWTASRPSWTATTSTTRSAAPSWSSSVGGSRPGPPSCAPSR